MFSLLPGVQTCALPISCRRPPRPARPEERAMKSNPLRKWLLIPVALLLVFVGVKLFSGAPGGQPAPKGAASTLTPEEMKALGIAGDTPRDTVATLVAQVKQDRKSVV